MSLSTKFNSGGRKTLTPEERKEKVAELRKYHQPYFESLGKDKARFVGKVLFGDPPHSAKFFEGELSNSSDLFVEWVTWDYQPEHDRALYKYKYDPDFASKFPMETTERGFSMYTVPIEQFELVREGIKTPKIEMVDPLPVQATLDFDFELTNPDEDVPLENITLRDLAAIMLKTPVSRKEWLNKIIKETCQK